jgi:hypothetical protein
LSMHLEGPWLSTTGKKKGKKKFASAEHARKAREQAEAWEELMKKYTPKATPKRNVKETASPVVTTVYRRETPKINSLPFTAGPCTKAEPQKYTGTLIKGIATMHKSNAVPVLNQQDAEDISKMRR